jgi:hypothetical protein
VRTYANKGMYILEVPTSKKAEIAPLMAYRGLTFSTSASTRDKAVLFSPNPYALADLADPATCPELAAYKREIDLSRALNGEGTRRLPPGKELWDYQKATLDYLLARGGGINGDQPGLGKTPTTVAFCNEVEGYRNLIIVPASVRIQWGERYPRMVDDSERQGRGHAENQGRHSSDRALSGYQLRRRAEPCDPARNSEI